MFDTPDLGPLCFGPIVATVTAILIYIVGRVVAKQRNDIVLAICLFALPLSCFASVNLGIGEMDPRPWFTPTANNVIGTWKIARNTREFLEDFYEVPVLPHELVFEADSSFHLRDLPTFWGLEDGPSYITGEGTWSFDQVEGNYQLETVIVLTFESLNGSSLTDEEQTVTMYFSGHLPPYTLRTLDTSSLTFSFRK